MIFHKHSLNDETNVERQKCEKYISNVIINNVTQITSETFSKTFSPHSVSHNNELMTREKREEEKEDDEKVLTLNSEIR